MAHMASNDLEEEVARYVDVKQNGKHLVDDNNFTYKKVRARAEKVYYACTHKNRDGCDATAVVQGDKIIRSTASTTTTQIWCRRGSERRRTGPLLQHLPTTPHRGLC